MILKNSRFIKLLIGILSFIEMTNGYADYKIAIYTDEVGSKKANEVRELFLKTYPFNQFEMEIEIKNVPSELLVCGSRFGIDRNIGCDELKDLALEAANNGINQVFVVKDLPQYGGSGGAIPVITSHSTPRMILHEYLHTLGFNDEYAYEASEAPLYCKESNRGANMVLIEPKADGYSNDLEAREKHSDQIPWFQNIKSTTLITHDDQKKLGTGKINSKQLAVVNESQQQSAMASAIGLYQGVTCDKANPPKYSWFPGGEASIMEFLEAGLGASNELIVAKILESRGVNRKIKIEPTSLEINDSSKLKNINIDMSIKNSTSVEK